MFCPQCGEKNEAGRVTCEACGAPLPPEREGVEVPGAAGAVAPHVEGGAPSGDAAYGNAVVAELRRQRDEDVLAVLVEDRNEALKQLIGTTLIGLVVGYVLMSMDDTMADGAMFVSGFWCGIGASVVWKAVGVLPWALLIISWMLLAAFLVVMLMASPFVGVSYYCYLVIRLGLCLHREHKAAAAVRAA